MKRALLLVSAAFTWVALAAVPAAAQDEHQGEAAQPAGEQVVLQGEVIDLTCYMANPDSSHGEAHASCAQQCLQGGQPAGILVRNEGETGTAGTLYLAIGADHGNASTMLAPHAGQVVQVRGRVLQHNGMQAIEVAEVVTQ